jgi:hypothetical protein
VLELVEKTEDENYEGLSLPDGTPTAMTITYDRDDYVVRFKEHYKPDKRISTKKFRSHKYEVSYSKIYQDLDNFMDKFVEEKQYQDLLDKLAAALSHGDLGAIKQCRENELDVSKPFFTFYGYADQEYEMLETPFRRAVNSADFDIMKYLLEQGVNVDEVYEEHTALSLVSLTEDWKPDVMKFLLFECNANLEKACDILKEDTDAQAFHILGQHIHKT